MKLLRGSVIAEERRKILNSNIQKHRHLGNRAPRLVVILVGTNQASESYVKHKLIAAKEVGIETDLLRFDETISPNKLYEKIKQLNRNSLVDAILIQLPLPKHFVAEDYLQAIDPNKDVDGFHYQNQGRLIENYPTIIPATPLGVLNLLDAYEIKIKGQHVVVIGTSTIVGKPLGMLLLNQGATVTFANHNTHNLSAITKTADILISATGQRFIVGKNMVKSNAVVIDIGIVRHPQTNKLVGDVDFEQVAPLTSAITPVPGGVGPMTVVSLLENTYQLYVKHLNREG